jgi:hypothetical protein
MVCLRASTNGCMTCWRHAAITHDAGLLLRGRAPCAILTFAHGDVAQLGERDNRTVEVRGSSPLVSTQKHKRQRLDSVETHPAVSIMRLKRVALRFRLCQDTFAQRPLTFGGHEREEVVFLLQLRVSLRGNRLTPALDQHDVDAVRQLELADHPTRSG